ncbi:MAG: tetratricopeptide repeat protein [Blastocatellia bacterium]
MMNRRRWFSALALVFILATAAAAQRSMIRGKVRTPGGNPVNDAIVELRFGGGVMIGQTVTRNDGDFAFNGLQPAEYEVAVLMAGYPPTAQVVRFDDAGGMNFMQVVTVEIILRPKPEAAPPVPATLFAQDVPKVARAAYEKAAAKLREGKSAEAIELLHTAIAEFSDYFDAHFALGQEMYRGGRDNEALEELERARQINDRQDVIYHLFGLIMFRQKKYALAQRAFREAENLKPNSPTAYFHRGMALVELGINESGEQRDNDFNEALHELDRAWELSDQHMNDVRLQRARVYERRGDKAAAARELEAYLKAEPEAKNAAAIKAAIAKLKNKK